MSTDPTTGPVSGAASARAANDFLSAPRQNTKPVPVTLTTKGAYELLTKTLDLDDSAEQARRCMDCGVPFCNQGCPLGNYIPDWQDALGRGDLTTAGRLLHATSNFPEALAVACPAPCEQACVGDVPSPIGGTVGYLGDGKARGSVTIKNSERIIIERLIQSGALTPVIASSATGYSVLVVGAGLAGLSAAQQLTRAGHHVEVADGQTEIGGLGPLVIPGFKLPGQILRLRQIQMELEGTRFRLGQYVGRDIPYSALDSYDAVILATGAPVGREPLLDGKPLIGRDLDGICQSMEYLGASNAAQQNATYLPTISAYRRNVLVVGGGDTAIDCADTALAQGANVVHMIDYRPKPPDARDETADRWPIYPTTMETRATLSHAPYETVEVNEAGKPHHIIYRFRLEEDEGQIRDVEVIRWFNCQVEEFIGDGGQVTGAKLHQVQWEDRDGTLVPTPKANSSFQLAADLVPLAIGFTGPERTLVDELGLETNSWGLVARDDNFMTSRFGYHACGDNGRGMSLLVWASAEGRACAAAVDAALMGQTLLPTPVLPTTQAMV